MATANSLVAKTQKSDKQHTLHWLLLVLVLLCVLFPQYIFSFHSSRNCYNLHEEVIQSTLCHRDFDIFSEKNVFAHCACIECQIKQTLKFNHRGGLRRLPQLRGTQVEKVREE